MFSYRELDGSASSYRYLLSARDGRELERALLTGASRRLGHQVNSLNDMQDTYYRVGPVEQYLMLTGRVYFRGLTYENIHRLQFDLETTAEGIENDEQLSALTADGCLEGQGYLFSKAQPQTEILKLLANEAQQAA